MTELPPQEIAVANEPDAIDTVSAILADQSATIGKLVSELADSYEKELGFFENLEARDRALKQQEDKFLKKIWWLEAELRKERQRTQRLSKDLQRLKRSRVVRMQYRVWNLRKVVRSWR